MKYSEMFRVKPATKVDLGKIDPNFTAKHKDKASTKDKIKKCAQHLRDLQYSLYAQGSM